MAAGKTVLHVDDEPIMVKMVRTVLEQAGYHALSATNSREALSYLVKVQPSVILLDVNLASESGYALCRAIRSRYPDLAAPVAFLTANRTLEDVRMAQESGGNYFIVKPFTADTLMAGIDKAFAHRRRAARTY